MYSYSIFVSVDVDMVSCTDTVFLTIQCSHSYCICVEHPCLLRNPGCSVNVRVQVGTLSLSMKVNRSWNA